ncbi:MAG: hypothetical protein AAF467_07725 [Actinomycetota bacterium]
MTAARPTPILALVAALAVTFAACTADADDSGSPNPTAGQGEASLIVANSPDTVTTNGVQRVLVAVIGPGGANDFLGGPDDPATVTFTSVESGSSSEVTGAWVANDGVDLGLYAVPVTFDDPGVWEVTLTSNAATASTLMNVGRESSVPGLGDAAPPSITPTAGDVDDLAEISTDPEPDPAFYELTIADAVANGRPTVVVFATPAFCQTALCGPTVEIIKTTMADHADVDVVHVEPFVLDEARAGSLVPVETMAEWGVQTEPWVFVVAADGTIAATFEGILGPDELGAALTAL